MAKKIEVDERIIQVQTQMDNIVEDIHDIDQQKAELQAVLNAKVQALKESFNSRIESLNSKREYLTAILKPLFEQVPQKIAQTQRKVILLSGEVVVKNAGKNIDYDKDKLLELAEKEEKERLEKYSAAMEELTNVLAKCEEIDSRIANEGIDESLIEAQGEAYADREAAYEKVASLSEPGFYEGFIKSKTTKEFDWAGFKKLLQISDDSIINTETGEIVKIEGLQVVDVPEEVIVK